MGCDIHEYVEIRPKEKSDHEWELYITPCLHRNYLMFGVFAGVRGESVPVIEPKGIPKDISFGVEKDYVIFVYGEEETDDPRYCTKTQAKEWVISGCSQKLKDNYISNPDWHTPSWFSLKDIKRVQKRYSEISEAEGCKGSVELNLLVSVMNHLEHQGYETRFVFWFDN